MAFLDVFNPNRKKWKMAIARLSSKPYWQNIIKEFLIKDNISYEKYNGNYLTNKIVLEYGMETWRMMNEASMEPKPEPSCTKSFEKYFMGGQLDRALAIPDWFYVAYPDVANWLENNIEELEKELSDKVGEISNDRDKMRFFRFLIQRYKNTVGELECAV
jgi:predicted ATP-binding protein involved in virulence